MIVGHRDVRRKIGMQGRSCLRLNVFLLFPTDVSTQMLPRPYQEWVLDQNESK